MRGDRLDRMFSNLPYDRVSDQWGSIVVNKTSPICVLKNCEVRNGGGVICDTTSLVLTNTIIHNCLTGVTATQSSVLVDSCLLSNAAQDCLSLYGCIADIDHTTLAQFYPYSANRGVALRFTDTKEEDGSVYLSVSNTLVTGYADDVVMGRPRDGSKVDYKFTNCLLRTSSVTDEEAFTDIIWEKTTDEIQGMLHFKNIDEKKDKRNNKIF